MTDQESGTDPVDTTVAVEDIAEGGAEPVQVGEPSFLADLARAMQSTAAAERSRDEAATEQRRQAHLDGIRAREAVEAEELRELAKEDVAAIDAWSDGEVRRIKLERERRISARREQLQLRLEEHRQVIGREISAVEAAVGSYRQQMDAFFANLESEDDPVEIARQAGERPRFPDLEQIRSEDVPVGSPPGATTAGAAIGTEEPSGAAATAPDGPATDTPGSTVEEASPGPAVGAGNDRLVGVMADGNAAAPVDGDQPPLEPAESVAPAEVAALVGGRTGEAAEQDRPADTPSEGDVRGVQPRTGAGSWLRWPNSSPDRSDSNK
jgi:hypothetical protein